MRIVAICVVLATASCTDPSVNANLRITPDGVRLVPYATARVGGIGVAVSE